MDNTRIWDKVKSPPPEALKEIRGGRLSGMTDISPIWRLHEATNLWGPCGEGWHYTIVDRWTENGANDEVVANMLVEFSYKMDDGSWSLPVYGLGGSMLVAKEKNGLHTSDEAWKMALTDGISVCLKALGFAADIYAGGNDSKYGKVSGPTCSASQVAEIEALIDEVGVEREKVLAWLKIDSFEDLAASRFAATIKALEAKR